MEKDNNYLFDETLSEEAAEAKAIQIIQESNNYLFESDNPLFLEQEEIEIIKPKLGKDKEDELAIRKWLLTQAKGRNKKKKEEAERILLTVYNIRIVSKEEYLKDKLKELEKK